MSLFLSAVLSFLENEVQEKTFLWDTTSLHLDNERKRVWSGYISGGEVKSCLILLEAVAAASFQGHFLGALMMNKEKLCLPL